MLTKTFKFNKFYSNEFDNNFSSCFDFRFFTFQFFKNFVDVKKVNHRNRRITSFINANAFRTFFEQQKKTTFFLRINATNTNHHNYQFFKRNSINKNDMILKLAKKHEEKIVLKQLMRNKKVYL